MGARSLTYCILLCLSSHICAEQTRSIKICTPEWEYYTEANGTGLYHELWAAIFKPANIKVDVRYVPFKRCEQTFINPHTTIYDAYTGGYGVKGQLIPQWHLGIDLLSIAYRKGYAEEWPGPEILIGKKVSWERGFDFDKHGVINVSIKLTEFTRLDSAIQMLQKERIDYVIDYERALKGVIKKLKLSGQLAIFPNVIQGPKYYLIFSNTERGKKLASIWDAGMARLHSTGQLQTMYSAYDDKGY